MCLLPYRLCSCVCGGLRCLTRVRTRMPIPRPCLPPRAVAALLHEYECDVAIEHVVLAMGIRTLPAMSGITEADLKVRTHATLTNLILKIFLYFGWTLVVFENCNSHCPPAGGRHDCGDQVSAGGHPQGCRRCDCGGGDALRCLAPGTLVARALCDASLHVLSVTAQVASLQLRLDDVTSRLAATVADRDEIKAQLNIAADQVRCLCPAAWRRN